MHELNGSFKCWHILLYSTMFRSTLHNTIIKLTEKVCDNRYKFSKFYFLHESLNFIINIMWSIVFLTESTHFAHFRKTICTKYSNLSVHSLSASYSFKKNDVPWKNFLKKGPTGLTIQLHKCFFLRQASQF